MSSRHSRCWNEAESNCGEILDAQIVVVDPKNEALETARQAGIDLSLIDSNLALSYEERVARHQDALELMLKLREAGNAHAQSRETATEVHRG
jgi:hypothetical protein